MNSPKAVVIHHHRLHPVGERLLTGTEVARDRTPSPPPCLSVFFAGDRSGAESVRSIRRGWVMERLERVRSKTATREGETERLRDWEGGGGGSCQSILVEPTTTLITSVPPINISSGSSSRRTWLSGCFQTTLSSAKTVSFGSRAISDAGKVPARWGAHRV